MVKIYEICVDDFFNLTKAQAKKFIRFCNAAADSAGHDIQFNLIEDLTSRDRDPIAEKIMQICRESDWYGTGHVLAVNTEYAAARIDLELGNYRKN